MKEAMREQEVTEASSLTWLMFQYLAAALGILQEDDVADASMEDDYARDRAKVFENISRRWRTLTFPAVLPEECATLQEEKAAGAY